MIVWVLSILAILICGAAWWTGVNVLSSHSADLRHIKGLKGLLKGNRKHSHLLSAVLIANFITLVFLLLLVGDLHNIEVMSTTMKTQYVAWKMFDCVIGAGILTFLKYLEHSEGAAAHVF